MASLFGTGKPVIILLFTGRPLDLSWESEHAAAILNVWFGGSESGDAIADVLYGKVNPSGRLTTSFPRSIGQVPIYYNHMNTGRPASDGPWASKYRDCPYTPVFPFGWGLSYTEYDYSNLTVKTECDKLVISADITNIGNMEGEEYYNIDNYNSNL